jgi:hypothetical protein
MNNDLVPGADKNICVVRALMNTNVSIATKLINCRVKLASQINMKDAEGPKRKISLRLAIQTGCLRQERPVA